MLDEFFAWLETVQVSGKGKLADAVRYALNERKYLYTFLENGAALYSIISTAQKRIRHRKISDRAVLKACSNDTIAMEGEK